MGNESTEATPAVVDAYDLADPVDVLSKVPANLQESLVSPLMFPLKLCSKHSTIGFDKVERSQGRLGCACCRT